MILLFSGGLDSYIAWHFLDKPKTLYLALGHIYQFQETVAVHKLIPNTIINETLHLGDREKPDHDIPMRNAFMLMIASFYDSELVLVVQKGEMSIPDRSAKFFDSFGAWLSWMNDKPIAVMTPFQDMTKTQMVKWYLDSALDPKDLIRTRSCFSRYEKPCGQCAACFRRWVAFVNNGFEENTLYNILEWDGVKNYVDKMKRGEYDEMRTHETFKALEIKGYSI